MRSTGGAFTVEPEGNLLRRRVGTVAGVALVGQHGTDIPVEADVLGCGKAGQQKQNDGTAHVSSS
jgi:hypothetical protein